MRARGITYDTGFLHEGITTLRPLHAAEVAREMRVIREELHATAVRVVGGVPERIEAAARLAAQEGLEVWFSPFTNNLSAEEMLSLLVDCARRAEALRLEGHPVVLVLGDELSLMNRGFLPGATLKDRLALLGEPARLREVLAGLPEKVDAFLGQAVAAVRDHFAGKLTYASIPFERVDWSRFDFVGVDFYRTAAIAHLYEQAVRNLVQQGKPVAITEFGAATFRGASARGAAAGEIIDWDGPTPRGLKGDFVRDEEEQARTVKELIALFGEAGVDSAFVFVFATYELPHHQDPKRDLDLASYGLVRVLEDPEKPWERKAAFHAVAEAYGAERTRLFSAETRRDARAPSPPDEPAR